MKTKLIITFATLLFSSAVFAKGDVKAGATKAMVCSACHGTNGLSVNDLWPNLKGQKAGYLTKQLKDFQSGARKDPLMTSQAKLLSEKDIEDIVAYYSELK